jgi:alkanesulfonate monooxygenase SsuD/methylene tetrahydromethanopterin reductase-like flavin-dependent oxidoreductase (luciferase family)
VPFTAPLRRTREYVEIIRLALSGRRVAYEGTEWNLPARGGLGLGKPLKLIAAPERGAAHRCRRHSWLRLPWVPIGRRRVRLLGR